MTGGGGLKPQRSGDARGPVAGTAKGDGALPFLPLRHLCYDACSRSPAATPRFVYRVGSLSVPSTCTLCPGAAQALSSLHGLDHVVVVCLAGGVPGVIPEEGSPPSANGDPRPACGAADTLAGGSASPQQEKADTPRRQKSCDVSTMSRPPNKDKQTNGLVLANGSGGMMTSGQRLLAAQSGASTLDPRPSDD